jgi:hypothetical protein
MSELRNQTHHQYEREGREGGTNLILENDEGECKVDEIERKDERVEDSEDC